MAVFGDVRSGEFRSGSVRCVMVRQAGYVGACPGKVMCGMVRYSLGRAGMDA